MMHDGGVDTDGIVMAGTSCLACGYDLHGLPRGGYCPECGESIARSLHVLLKFQSPSWLARLLAGNALLVLAALLPLAAGIAGRFGWNVPWAWRGWCLMGVMTIFAAGFALVLFPEGRDSGPYYTAIRRNALWISLLAAAGDLYLTVLWQTNALYSGWQFHVSLLTFSCPVLFLVGVVLTLIWLGRLCTKIPSHRLTRHFYTAAWLTLLIGVLCGVLWVWFGGAERLPAIGFGQRINPGDIYAAVGGGRAYSEVVAIVFALGVGSQLLVAYIILIMLGLCARIAGAYRAARNPHRAGSAKTYAGGGEIRLLHSPAIVGVCLTVLLMVGGVLIQPLWYHWRISVYARRTNASMSAATAQWLGGALDRNRVGTKLGNKIVAALGTPEVYTRSPYNGKAPIQITLNWPNKIRFKHLNVRVGWDAFGGGHKKKGWETWGNGDFIPQPVENIDPQNARGPVQGAGPSHYRTTIVFHYKITNKHSRKQVFAAKVRLPVKFKVAGAAQSEHVKLVSNPGLDKAMHAAASFEPRPKWSATTDRYGKDRIYVIFGGVHIHLSHVPQNVFFKAKYIDSSGSTFMLGEGSAFSPPTWGLLKSSTGTLQITPLRFDFAGKKYPSIGKHHGHILLIPAPKIAYGDARFKKIWDGTLRFPWSFKIYHSSTYSKHHAKGHQHANPGGASSP